MQSTCCASPVIEKQSESWEPIVLLQFLLSKDRSSTAVFITSELACACTLHRGGHKRQGDKKTVHTPSCHPSREIRLVATLVLFMLCRESSQNGTATHQHTSLRPCPSDSELEEALRQVRLDALRERAPPSAASSSSNGAAPATGLDAMADWAGILSLGEQQRLAFAR